MHDEGMTSNLPMGDCKQDRSGASCANGNLSEKDYGGHRSHNAIRPALSTLGRGDYHHPIICQRTVCYAQ